MLASTLSILAASQLQNLCEEKLEISCEDLAHCVSSQRTHPAEKYF